MLSIYIVQLFSTAVVLLLLEPLLRVYNLSSEAMNLTRQIVWYHGIAMCLIWPLAYTYPTVFRAAGDAKYPMIGKFSLHVCLQDRASLYLCAYV
ncbi:hypothetical protein VB002_07165 [Campylobacter concisus]